MARGQMRLRKRSIAPSQTKKRKGAALQAKFNSDQEQSTAMGKDSPLVRSGNIVRRIIEREAQTPEGTETASTAQPTLQMKESDKTPFLRDRNLAQWFRVRSGNPHHLSSIQREITVGKVGDKYEQQADAVAAEVTESIRSPETQPENNTQEVQKQEEESLQTFSVQRKLDRYSGLKAPSLQREEMAPEEDDAMVQGDSLALQGGAVSPEFEQELKDKKQSGGESLSGESQQVIEDKTGWKTGNVEIHTDVKANQLSKSIGAKSFASENHIFYANSSDYGRDLKSSSKSQQHLMLHEITHSRQQGALQAKTDKSNSGRLTQPLDLQRQVQTGSSGTVIQRTPLDVPFQQALDYMRYLKKFPFKDKPQLADIISIDDNDFITIKSPTKFEILCHFAKSEFSDENTNGIILLNHVMHSDSSETLMAAAELVSPQNHSYKYQEYLNHDRYNYPTPTLPEDINLPSGLSRELGFGIQRLENAQESLNNAIKNKAGKSAIDEAIEEKVDAHINLSKQLRLVAKEILFVLQKDTLTRFRTAVKKPEELFPRAVRLYNALTTPQFGGWFKPRGIVKARVLGGYHESKSKYGKS